MIELVTGAVITFVAATVGFLAGRITRKPMCACGHPPGTHTDDGCQADIRRQEYTESGGWGYVRVWVDCPCWTYVGPPLARFSLTPPPPLPSVPPLMAADVEEWASRRTPHK